MTHDPVTSAPALPAARPSRDDATGFASTLAMGERPVPGGDLTWTSIAIAAHLVLFAWAYVSASLSEMRHLIAELQQKNRAFYGALIEIDTAPEKKADKPPEPPPEPPPAPPEPAAPAVNAPAPKAPKNDDPYDPPPAAAQAAKVLTAEEKLDFTGGDTIVSGEGTGPSYGMVSAAGTASAPTFDRNAQVGGVPGATGTGKPQPPPPPPPGPDRSKPPGLSGGSWSNCPFPPEADAEQIDEAVAQIIVTVRPDGSPASVRVVSDPGHGFGRQARICALSKRFTPGLDRDGNATMSTTPPISVRFTR